MKTALSRLIPSPEPWPLSPRTPSPSCAAPPRRPIAACAADDCILFFLHRHAKRQWRSTRCGDRARVARHHACNRTTR
ncbi:CGNR zinc finger domain-containing protein [Streptomyces sp. NPDC001222]|uniref:CGNR zinc finger domain-containing protein n=1 Tax=Streptomyces sp. NPDC001222 TaxID=3364548 RepID=UPI00369BBB62